MRTLVIETATAACSVALIEDGMVIARDHVVVGRGHAERLVPMIAGLPDQGRADAILVDCGPGSFTGVRVGLAAARGLGIGWGVPVGGYSSLALIAAAALNDRPDDTIVAVLDGGHGEVFQQGFDGALVADGPAVSRKPADAVAVLAGRRVVGQGLARLRTVDDTLPACDRLPDAADAVLLPPAQASLPPAPLYGRAPDAVPSVRA
ncbi:MULTISPECIES: tRNA (adenosine(37)-N6)-threonylcarbamoyltransferase complex dimerization subunit type 1 TsaB [unclassified Sphingomonas]|uniref:tRNA (adenosine(37)-N6)-threonylcarbamoyltransferase complex dimerization subunit type 1 TsaB n=1 Tax=unclassified Sphingomonas TaxID=196159 RepID=UPI0006FE6DE3|nr:MULTISPECIES: tRNA (adenosine(37)-N6)-threonylcarbamoyltransferase complex dimerization subunit type 1 TsaB [unclassified Sphingomonas]KQM61523.1 tRNA threonylcarbamoyladenosine biosynthesis protein TsaB [Sphingomonas sp. Leaf16]KQN12619.1 tRNA threonylcarbamoyladenosine biosynthesis protein TsaB [Sphingomonas sp. Leaf29]KQN19098.1 tRNA threonylcarbamoyladenosine biosynthesis protein TsaB [Sphingomonas sp. Leaf32]